MSGGLWIIGFRAAGKTTLGRLLAEKGGADFLDLDEEWEKREGTSILAFVDKYGIEAFRRGEENLLRETASQFSEERCLVVSTGGGFVDWGPSRAILEKSPEPKLYLDPGLSLIWERLQELPDRQKIGDLSSFEAVKALFEKRRPFYEKISTIDWKDQDINGCLAALKPYLKLNFQDLS